MRRQLSASELVSVNRAQKVRGRNARNGPKSGVSEGPVHIFRAFRYTLTDGLRSPDAARDTSAKGLGPSLGTRGVSASPSVP
jgi:hypothetical protein